MDRDSSIFKTVNLVTICAVYLLILVGGVVRNLEAGMGCPDWPKCFGNYIPPSDASDLPDNYKELFVEQRLKKNKRLAKTLTFLGWKKLAEKIKTHPSISEEADFSLTKAWVEYFNRILGVIIGLLIILNFWFSWKLRYSDKWMPAIGAVALLLVIFQGWVGSLVVSTNLLPGFITFHMMLAMALVALLVYQQFKVSRGHVYHSHKWVITILLILSLVQVFLGTGVRESIDLIHAEGLPRGQWIEALGTNFYIHRSFSILILVVTFLFLYYERKVLIENRILMALCIILILEIGFGVLMAYFNMPPFIQPLHLLFGTLLFGVLFYLFLDIIYKPTVS